MRSWIVPALLLALSLCVTPLAAQQTPASPPAPLIVLIDKQFFVWPGGQTSPLVPYSCQPDEKVYLDVLAAPSGDGLVFQTEWSVVTERIAEMGGVGGGPLPNNIGLCLNGQYQQLAGQPPDASFMDQDVPARAMLRSQPVWSPDGDAIAYTEMMIPEDPASGPELVIVALPSGETTRTTLANLPAPMGVPAPPQVLWGQLGLIVIVNGLDDVTFEFIEVAYIYDRAGNQLAEARLFAQAETDDFSRERLLLTYQGREFFGYLFDQAGWTLVDPRTGERQPMPGVPERYSVRNPAGISLSYQLTADYQANWRVHVAQGQTLNYEAYPPQRIALAPNGDAFAFADSVLNIWREGAAFPVTNSDAFADEFGAAIIWGPVHWRVREGATFPEAAATPLPTLAPPASAPTLAPTVIALPTCPGTLPSRLRPATTARVIEATVPNNMRAQPSVSGDLVGQIPGGGTFTVLEGPTCADGYAWYRVAYNGVTGWTAEAAPDDYWLEPVP